MGRRPRCLPLFDFDYEAGRDQLLRLYDKGTRKQWIGSERIDWSTEIDPDNPTSLPDEFIASTARRGGTR